MRRRAPALAFILAALAANAAVSTELSLEGGPFLPYRINRALLVADSPFRGAIEARGLRWDGSEALLFSGEAAASTREAELAFYLDESFRAIELRAGGLSLLVDLSAATGLGAATSEEEAGLRNVMRNLHPPATLGGRLAAESSLALGGLDLASASLRIADRLFLAPLPIAAFALLAAAALAATLAAAAPGKGVMPKRPLIGARIAASLACAFAIAALAAPPPALYRASFPVRESRASLAGAMERRVEGRRGYRLVECALRDTDTSANGRSTLVALSAPRFLVPLEEAVPEGCLSRFSPPPIVYARGGDLYISSIPPSIGWVVDARR